MKHFLLIAFLVTMVCSAAELHYDSATDLAGTRAERKDESHCDVEKSDEPCKDKFPGELCAQTVGTFSVCEAHTDTTCTCN